MKKGAILALAGLMAASAAHATEPRAWSFGDASLFIADSTDWKSLPQTPNGNSIVWEDIDGSYWMSASHNLLGGTLAIYNGRESWDLGFAYANTGLTGPSTGTNPGFNWNGVNDLTDVLFATNLNDNVRLGVGLTWGADGGTYKDEYAGTPTSTYQDDEVRSVMGISLGSDLKEVGPFKVLQLGLQYFMHNETETYVDNSSGSAVTNKKTGDNSRVQLRVGGDTAGENGAFGRLELGLSSSNSTVKSGYAVAPAAGSRIENTASNQGFNLGYAMGTSGEKGMILGGLNLMGYGYADKRPNNYGANTSYSDEWGGLDLVASAAAEASVVSWLTVRGGVDAIILGAGSEKYSYTYGTAADEVETYTWENQGSVDLNLGTTIKVGNFAIDGWLSPSWLAYGPYILSGNNNDDVWWNTSVTYTMGE